MNFIKKVILMLKNIFIKQENIKKISAPENIVEKNKKNDFAESLKSNTTDKKTKKKIETLTCKGDGLGIKKKISY